MTYSAFAFTLILAVSGQSCLDSFKSNPTAPTVPAAGTAGFSGTWASVAASTVQETCTNFQWSVTSVSLTSASGNWSAKCWGNVAVNGTASGTLDATRLTWSAIGIGAMPNGGTCPVSLSGTATLEGNQIRIPYTGSTCYGAVAGTEILRKP
ncbi:MAG TPA: hypothetical protein PKW63_00495 [Vicinamibacterales bacterium]|nr:hypothetical protein [Acidobacteriota bacterium]HQX80196.1 hypothetical protein [Vicinamibacterales bacterium]